MIDRIIATATTIRMRYFLANSIRRKSTRDRPATLDPRSSNDEAAELVDGLGAGSMIWGID